MRRAYRGIVAYAGNFVFCYTRIAGFKQTTVILGRTLPMARRVQADNGIPQAVHHNINRTELLPV